MIKIKHLAGINFISLKKPMPFNDLKLMDGINKKSLVNNTFSITDKEAE
ncbi:MAG: hypothetical protein ABI594_19315 [Ginsengibacter sp.]